MSREKQVALYTAHANLRGCERELNKVKHGCRPDRFTCSCSRVFVHVCDEAEGCCWTLQKG